jgi:hypothetical protein
VGIPSAATLLDDGNVLIANNWSAAVYNPANGTFRVTGAADPNPAQLNFVAFGAAPLMDGRVRWPVAILKTAILSALEQNFTTR